jgi:hypothetical protein
MNYPVNNVLNVGGTILDDLECNFGMYTPDQVVNLIDYTIKVSFYTEVSMVKLVELKELQKYILKAAPNYVMLGN